MQGAVACHSCAGRDPSIIEFEKLRTPRASWRWGLEVWAGLEVLALELCANICRDLHAEPERWLELS